MVYKKCFTQVLEKLFDYVRRKSPEINKNFIRHQDNARMHTAALTQKFFRKFKTKILFQLPHSPDSAHYDFWLFLKLKKCLQGCCLKTNKAAI